VQIAYAVTDVRAAAESFATRLGAGPFFVRDHGPLPAIYGRGEPGTFDHSSAYGQWGSVQIELVEIHEATPATLAESVLRTSGLHHVAWFVASIDEERRRLTSLGWPSVLLAETPSGLRFAFHDARPELGHLVEIYEPTDAVRRLYGKVAEAAQEWDGRDPVLEW